MVTFFICSMVLVASLQALSIWSEAETAFSKIFIGLVALPAAIICLPFILLFIAAVEVICRIDGYDDM